MSEKLEALCQNIRDVLGEAVSSLTSEFGQVTLEVRAQDYLRVAQILRDEPMLGFGQLMDLCGVDYSAHARRVEGLPRYAVVSQLLSLSSNRRLRLRTYAPDDAFPVVDSLTAIWPSAAWFEREAFDMLGVMFVGHSDLRRILTDYGFVGHPLRKDFPVTGYVEMRYDPEQGRVIYQPVTIEPRENTPRIVREDNYGSVDNV